MKSRRANKTLSRHELARFLVHLAETGNFALACSALGRSKSGLYKRRARDPLFDSDCVAAIAQFRISSSLAAGRGGGPFAAERMVEGSHTPLKTGWNSLTLSTHRGRPQLRRAVSGCLTRAGVETFLLTLAATGNVRFAAHSVGVAHSSIYARRRKDPVFAGDMDAALDMAIAALEMRVIEASGVFLDEEPSPHCGGGSLGKAERGEGEISSLTAAEALHFLTLHMRRRKREGGS